MDLLLSERLPFFGSTISEHPTGSYNKKKQIQFVCYLELQCKSSACIVLTCCLQNEKTTNKSLLASRKRHIKIQDESVGRLKVEIETILHQDAEGVSLMVADPFPNEDFLMLHLKIVQPVLRTTRNNQHLCVAGRP